MFFWVLEERLDKERRDFMVLGFQEKKIFGVVLYIYISFFTKGLRLTDRGQALESPSFNQAESDELMQ